MEPRLKMTKLIVFMVAAVLFSAPATAESPNSQGIRTLVDVSYKSGDDLTEYEKTRCKLDVYLPANSDKFATLVWFHGGGLKNGDKDGRQIENDSVKTVAIAGSLAKSGIAVVSANYRLSPKVTFPAYIQDAAFAVSWAKQNMGMYGGDPNKLFIGGHSAGGYLALMLGMDGQYLTAAGVKLEDVAGVIPVSGQTMTHYTVREERGIGKNQVTADQAAPVHFVRKTSPPFLVLYADRDMAARAEENAYFVAMMQGVGNKNVSGLMIEDRTHGSIASHLVNADDPARKAILEFIQVHSKARE
jgi:acetyl esterase/lipase